MRDVSICADALRHETCWQAQAGYAETTDTISQRLSVLLPADYQFYTPYKVILPTQYTCMW